jgi:hypothetical protein
VLPSSRFPRWVERDNKDKRKDWGLRGLRQVDALVCVIITYDRLLDGRNDMPFDCRATATAPASYRGLRALHSS